MLTTEILLKGLEFMKNKNCSCPHMTCMMHGDCKQCTEFHKGKPYCKVGTVRKARMRVVFKAYDTVQDLKKRRAKQKGNDIL